MKNINVHKYTALKSEDIENLCKRAESDLSEYNKVVDGIIKNVKNELNSDLDLDGILLTMYDSRNNNGNCNGSRFTRRLTNLRLINPQHPTL